MSTANRGSRVSDRGSIRKTAPRISSNRISQRRRTIFMRENPKLAVIRAKSEDERAQMIQVVFRGWQVRSKLRALTRLDFVFQLCSCKKDAVSTLTQNAAEYPDYLMLQRVFGISAAKIFQNYEFRNEKSARLQLILMRHFRRNMWGNAPTSLRHTASLDTTGVGDIEGAVTMRALCARKGWACKSAIVVDTAACIDTAMLMGFDVIARWPNNCIFVEALMASLPQLCMDSNILSVVIITTGPMLDGFLRATNTVLDHEPQCGDMISRLSCFVRVPRDSPASWHTAAEREWVVELHARCALLRKTSDLEQPGGWDDVVLNWHAIGTEDMWNAIAGCPLMVGDMLEKLRAESEIRCIRLKEKDKTWLQGNDFKMLKFLFQEMQQNPVSAGSK